MEGQQVGVVDLVVVFDESSDESHFRRTVAKSNQTVVSYLLSVGKKEHSEFDEGGNRWFVELKNALGQSDQ